MDPCSPRRRDGHGRLQHGEQRPANRVRSDVGADHLLEHYIVGFNGNGQLGLSVQLEVDAGLSVRRSRVRVPHRPLWIL